MSSKRKKPIHTSATSKSQLRILLQRSKGQQHGGRSFSQDNSFSIGKNLTGKDDSTALENDDGFLFKRFSTGRSLSDNSFKVSKSENPVKSMEASGKYKLLNEGVSKKKVSNAKKHNLKNKTSKPVVNTHYINKNSSTLLDMDSDSDDHLDNSIYKIEKVQNSKERIIKSRNKLRDLAIQLTEINDLKNDSKSDLIKPMEKSKSKARKKVQPSKHSSSKKRLSSIIPGKIEVRKSESSPKKAKALNSENAESKRVQSDKRKNKKSHISSNLDISGFVEISEASDEANNLRLNRYANLGEEFVNKSTIVLEKNDKKTNHSVNLEDSKKIISKTKIGSIPNQVPPGIKQPLKLSPVKLFKATTNNRRSSLGNRGKRTSSVGNGFQVSPHESIPPLNFYKHLNQDLPEPHRMRQLLAWCLKRQLDDDKKSDDSSNRRSKLFNNEELIAKNIATVIKEEVLRDLVDGKIKTSWWNREDYEDEINQPAKKKRKIVPNGQNEENLNTLKILEKHLSRLRKENSELDKLSDKYNYELKVSRVLDSNSGNSEEFVKSHIEKSILKKNRKDSSTVNNSENFFYNSFIKEKENVKNLNRASKLMSDIKLDYIESLKKLNEFADRLNYNEAYAKNFQYIKNRELSKVIKNYISKSFIDKNIRATDNINNGFNNIDILKGISRIDKS